MLTVSVETGMFSWASLMLASLRQSSFVFESTLKPRDYLCLIQTLPDETNTMCSIVMIIRCSGRKQW